MSPTKVFLLGFPVFFDDFSPLRFKFELLLKLLAEVDSFMVRLSLEEDLFRLTVLFGGHLQLGGEFRSNDWAYKVRVEV